MPLTHAPGIILVSSAKSCRCLTIPLICKLPWLMTSALTIPRIEALANEDMEISPLIIPSRIKVPVSSTKIFLLEMPVKVKVEFAFTVISSS